MDKKFFRDRLEDAKKSRGLTNERVDLPEISEDAYVTFKAISVDDFFDYSLISKTEDKWGLIIVAAKLDDGSRAFELGDIEFLNSLGVGVYNRLLTAAVENSGITHGQRILDKAKLIEVPYYDFCFTLMEGPYRGTSLEYVRSLPMSEIIEWHMRYERSPWGSYIDNLKHYQACSLHVSKNRDAFKIDKSHEIMKKLRIDVLGLEGQEINREENAQEQAGFLAKLRAKFGSTKHRK